MYFQAPCALKPSLTHTIDITLKFYVHTIYAHTQITNTHYTTYTNTHYTTYTNITNTIIIVKQLHHMISIPTSLTITSDIATLLRIE